MRWQSAYNPTFKSRNTAKLLETKKLYNAKGKLCVKFLFPYKRRRNRYSLFVRGQGVRIVGVSKHYNLKRHIREAFISCFFMAQILYGKTNEPFEVLDYTIVYYKGRADGKAFAKFETKKIGKKRYNIYKEYNVRSGRYHIVSKDEYMSRKETTSEIDQIKSEVGIYGKY